VTAAPLSQLLRERAEAPEGQAPEAWRTARALLQGERPAEAAEALPEPLLQALLEALVAERRTGPLESLAASAHKRTAKAARRAQYRLRSAGVPTERRLAAAPAPPTAPEPAAELPSLVSPPDGAGEFLLLLARPVRGGLALHELVLSDELGVVGHLEAETSRSSWRRSLREARERPLREIALGEAKRLLAEALRCNLATHSPLPKGTEDLLRRLEVLPASAPPEPLPTPLEGDASLALEASQLHEEPELRGWLPPQSELQVLAARVQEVRTSPLALSEPQRAEQLQERVRAMAQAFFTPERSRLYARRLWLTADVFERSGRPRPAEVARAEARRLFHQPPGLFSRFAEGLYTKLLQPSARPDSAAVARGAAPAGAETAGSPAERRSKGGLILP
jgi:hypothetical protein